MSSQKATTTVDPEYKDEAFIVFKAPRSGLLSNPPHLGDKRRYVIAGTCRWVTDELQDNGDTKLVCTIKTEKVYEIGVRGPDDGAGLFQEPCPHCGHANVGDDPVNGEVVSDDDATDGPAAIGSDQLAITAGDDIVDAEVVEDSDADVVDGEVDDDADDYMEGDGDDEVGADAAEPDGLESDGYEPSGMDEFVAPADPGVEPAGDDQDGEDAEDGVDEDAADSEPVDPDETPQQRKARLQRERRARQRKERDEAADSDSDADGSGE